jgi:hypothetical protein
MQHPPESVIEAAPGIRDAATARMHAFAIAKPQARAGM